MLRNILKLFIYRTLPAQLQNFGLFHRKLDIVIFNKIQRDRYC